MPEPGMARFCALQGQRFVVQRETGEPVDTALVEVRRLPVPPRQGRQAFALLFRGPVAPLLPQRTYRMRCDGEAEALDIFLVPVAADASGTLYEAIFG